MRNLIISLNKKRNQSKNAITEMVKYCLTDDVYKHLTTDEQVKLLKTLIEITEGRIYVEYEYSVSIRRLTEIYLSKNDIEEASKLVQDIQVIKV
jgi:26S proteasome regulatory subunit N5